MEMALESYRVTNCAQKRRAAASQPGRWTFSLKGWDAKPKLSSAAEVLRITRKSYLGILYRVKLICRIYLANS